MKNNKVASLSFKSGMAAKANFLGAGSFNIFDGLIDGICIINERGYIEYFNDAYERILRISSRIEPGQNIFMIKNDDVLLTAFRERRCICGRLALSKSDVQVSASASPIFSDGEFKGVIAIYREEAVQDKCRRKDTVIEFNSATVNYMNNIRDMFKDIIGKSSSLMEALKIAYKAAQTSSNVLISGESGTGKGLIARAIHNNSRRAKGPYLIVNCGAIPSTLLESELFGYEQGAFTGAVRRKIGKFERADGGTLFLDEIGDMPRDMQVKILRVIQDKEFERIGSNDTIKCDVRIIAATHCNLETLIEKGTFREDLYYRLNVLPIYVPSLKERREDIPMLLEHFINRISIDMNREITGVSPEAENCLLNYDWPGNIRELENLVERVIALTDGNEIDINSLPSKISSLYRVNQNTYSTPALINMNNSGNIATLEEYEKEIIKEALARFGSYNAAGKALGITHRTVALKARRYNIVI
ncbi:MAG: sigma-54 interaction domain-containing protein [Lutisporaceae bacterium]